MQTSDNTFTFYNSSAYNSIYFDATGKIGCNGFSSANNQFTFYNTSAGVSSIYFDATGKINATSIATSSIAASSITTPLFNSSTNVYTFYNSGAFASIVFDSAGAINANKFTCNWIDTGPTAVGTQSGYFINVNGYRPTSIRLQLRWGALNWSSDIYVINTSVSIYQQYTNTSYWSIGGYNYSNNLLVQVNIIGQTYLPTDILQHKLGY